MKSSGVPASTFSVGELAERFGLETHVLRYWEEVGLLAPARAGAGRRRYSADDVVRVATVLSSKVAGMSLDQIQALLDAGPDSVGAPERHRVLEAHLAELDRRQAEIERSRRMTQHALECQAHDIATCVAPSSGRSRHRSCSPRPCPRSARPTPS
jgi:DNA-binding transcriptional MerR regulator